MYILAIETSCDDTAVALYHSDRGLLGQRIRTQNDLLNAYGGVVPELASREHLQYLLPMIDELLSSQCQLSDLEAIAYTRGPGLIGALLCGYSVARGLSLACNIPMIGIHHLEAHIQSIFLEDQKPSYPFLTLLVSGGHTLLVEAAELGRYKIIGRTLDDAAGEAFDKIAKLLGLGFPGGAKLSKMANAGSCDRWSFPRPMLEPRHGFDMSFSGLKTAARLAWESCDDQSALLNDFCASYQEAIVDVLVTKTQRAMAATHLKSLVLAGGVAANARLREKMSIYAENASIKLYIPSRQFCTDNAAMVAVAASKRLSRGKKDSADLTPTPIWSLEDLS